VPEEQHLKLCLKVLYKVEYVWLGKERIDAVVSIVKGAVANLTQWKRYTPIKNSLY
jgi:hypothetical protein